MLFLLSGASCSGKKTIAPLVAQRAKHLVSHHEGEILALNRRERMANMERWLETAAAYEAKGNDLLLLAASPLGEVLASPAAPELSAIAACLLDCHDHERSRRLAKRPVDPRWPFGMDTLCWAAFHRMHAIDPRFEQRVLREPDDSRYQWSRWTSWTRDDPRWRVEYVDTTSQTIEETAEIVTRWVERTRANGTALSRASRWWET